MCALGKPPRGGRAGQDASSRRGSREDTSPDRLWVGTLFPGATRGQNRVMVRRRGRGRAEQER